MSLCIPNPLSPPLIATCSIPSTMQENTEKLVTTLLDGLYPVEDLLPIHMCDLHIETELKRDNLSFGYEQFL